MFEYFNRGLRTNSFICEDQVEDIKPMPNPNVLKLICIPMARWMMISRKEKRGIYDDYVQWVIFIQQCFQIIISGKEPPQINTFLAAAGWNLKKMMNKPKKDIIFWLFEGFNAQINMLVPCHGCQVTENDNYV